MLIVFVLVSFLFIVNCTFQNVDLVHNTRRVRFSVSCSLLILIGKNDFSFQCRKIIIRYICIGYNFNVMRA